MTEHLSHATDGVPLAAVGFSRRVDVLLFKDEPDTREDFVERIGLDEVETSAGFIDETYEKYLHSFQPFWWHAKSPNGEILTNGEHYARKSGALNSIALLFGDDTTMYWMPMFGQERGMHLLRYGVTDLQHQASKS